MRMPSLERNYGGKWGGIKSMRGRGFGNDDDDVDDINGQSVQ